MNIHNGFISSPFLNIIEIFPLDIFNKRLFQQLRRLRFSNNYRHLTKTGFLGGTPSSLTGNKLILEIGEPPNENGLKNTFFFDGFGKLQQRFLIKFFPWLSPVRNNILNITMEKYLG